MRLLHRDYQFKVSLKENHRILFIIESPEVFRQLIQEFMIGQTGEECGFVLSEENIPIKMQDNLKCIINPFEHSLNERKLLNKLYELLKKEIQSTELLLENNNIYAMIENYSIHISQQSDWELSYTDKADIQNLLKFMDIKFVEHEESLIEKIIDYIKVSHELMGIKCFVFVHLLSYLKEYEIEKLYEFAQYQKIIILLMESKQPDDIKKFNSVIIIDKNCCEIELNM